MPLLEMSDVKRTYRSRRGLFARPEDVHAVNGVSLSLDHGRTLGLVGESGCGKSTTGRLALGLEPADGGEVRFDGVPLPAQNTAAWRRLRRRMQLVFQDPLGALDRRLPIATQIVEPLVIHRGKERPDLAAESERLLRAVGLRPDQGRAYPHELSGGQRQRAVLARAIATRPDLLVCDEPVSALDVSIQAQMVNLLQDLQQEFGLALLFISHDLKLVGNIADEIAIMYLGTIVERGAPGVIYDRPAHPYTKALLSAIPDPQRKGKRKLLAGEPPNPAARPTGCAFHPRCPIAIRKCSEVEPALLPEGADRMVACHLAHAGGIAREEAASAC